jgi:hypothetical protein
MAMRTARTGTRAQPSTIRCIVCHDPLVGGVVRRLAPDAVRSRRLGQICRIRQSGTRFTHTFQDRRAPDRPLCTTSPASPLLSPALSRCNAEARSEASASGPRRETRFLSRAPAELLYEKCQPYVPVSPLSRSSELDRPFFQPSGPAPLQAPPSSTSRRRSSSEIFLIYPLTCRSVPSHTEPLQR